MRIQFKIVCIPDKELVIADTFNLSYSLLKQFPKTDKFLLADSNLYVS